MRTPIRLALALALGATLAGAGGCEDDSYDSSFDAGPDLFIAPGITKVGAQGVTCCMVAQGDFVLYLLNPQPGGTNSRGITNAPNGQLHVANPYADWVLADDVAANAYGFSPDGNFAIYAQKSTQNYSLNLAPLRGPVFPQPVPIQVIADGLSDDPLNYQGFFSPTGRYFILGAKPKNVDNTPDLHVVDMQLAKDVFQLPGGSFYYFQGFASYSETMLFNNSTASTVAGTPSVEGLYYGSIGAMINGAQPARIDTHVGLVSSLYDGKTVIYARTNGDFKLFDLQKKYAQTIATNVATISSGPQERGPLSWIATDRSLHVAPLFGSEVLATPPGSADPAGPIEFSPDGGRVYWFQQYSTQQSYGELWTARLPPGGDGKPKLVAPRVSAYDFSFIGDRMMWIRDVDAYGVAGELVASDFDGANVQVMSRGVTLGGVRSAAPVPPAEPTTPGSTNHGPFDFGVYQPPPVFANLTSAQRDLDNIPIDLSKAVYGALSFGTTVGGPQGVVNPAVKQGQYRFSDDGYVLAYAGDAHWDDAAQDYVGTLGFFGTLPSVHVTAPLLEGVNQVGAIHERKLFVSAPAAADPGIYFIKY